VTAKLPLKKKTAPVVPLTEADAPVVWIHVGQLVPNPRNPNRHTEGTFQTIRASVEASGFTGAIVAWTECDEPRPAEAAEGPVCLLGHGHARRKVMLDLWAEKPDYQIDGAPGPGFMPVRLMAWGSREACDAYLIAANQTGKGTTWDRGALDRLRHDSAARDWPHTKAALQSLPVLMRPGPPPIVAPSLPSLVRPPPPPEVIAQKKTPPPPDRWGVFGMDLPITSTEHAEMMEALEEYQQANGTYAGAGDHIARAVTAALAERTAQGAQVRG
jgi:hypothetical protein